MVDIQYGDGGEGLKKDFGLKSWLTRKVAAEQSWKSVQTQGWEKTRPLWGTTAEPCEGLSANSVPTLHP